MTTHESGLPIITNATDNEVEKDIVGVSFQQNKHNKQIKHDCGSLELPGERLEGCRQVRGRLLGIEWAQKEILELKKHIIEGFWKHERAGKFSRVV